MPDSRPSAPGGRPKRVQRKRTAGWRMPEGAVYVGRPTVWGNPFTIAAATEYYRDFGQPDNGDTPREIAVRWYREWLAGEHYDPETNNRRIYIVSKIARLRGKTLACFCPLDQPCHADVLLELANADDPT